MAEQLEGVPKHLLRTVFGRVLGNRIWQRARSEYAKPADGPVNQVADAEISTGMVTYVAQRAASTLRERNRQAKAIRLTVTYANGESHAAQKRLARPTTENNELMEAATELLRRFPVRGVQSVDLAIAAVEAAASTL